MAEKSRLREDAFDWIQDTTKGQEESTLASSPIEEDPQVEAPEAEAAGVGNATATIADQTGVQSEGERSIFVKYRKDNGAIMSIREALPNRQLTGLSRASIPDDMAVAKFVLVGDLLDKRIIEIHHQYKVTKSGRRTQLTPKT
jgi:hypothetical protein